MSDEKNLTVYQPAEAPQQFQAFSSIVAFENAQRMAKALCHSAIVPEAYRGDSRLGDCVIALEIANRIGATVLAVMQNLYIVYGKPGWSAQFLISCLNSTGNFTPLRYNITGKPGTDSWGCIAWAKDRSGEALESPEVTIAMAKAEGWYDKKGSKWQTMPELMLRYRAATFFVRLYAPELTMGIQTQEEIIDVESAPVPEVKRPALPGPSPVSQLPAQDAAPQSAPASKARTTVIPGRSAKPARSAPAASPHGTAAPTPPPDTKPEPATATAAEPTGDDALTQAIADAQQPEQAPESTDPPELVPLVKAMHDLEVNEDQVLKFCAAKKLFRPDGKPAEWLRELSPDRMGNLHKALTLPNSPILNQIKAIK